MATAEDYKRKLAEVSAYLKHYGYTVHVRSADDSYALYSREASYMNMHTHVTIEVRIDGSGNVFYEVGALMPEVTIMVKAGKTTNPVLIWRYAEIVHRMITACKIKARTDEVGTGEACELMWRLTNA